MEPAAEALARLTALKSNLPNPLGVQEKMSTSFTRFSFAGTEFRQ